MATTRIRGGFLLALTTLTITLAVDAVTPVSAYDIDPRGEMRLGLRAYTAVRVGTERIGGSDNPLNWPVSPAGHVRQHRYFLQIDWEHDLRRLAKDSWGLMMPFRWMDADLLKYTVQYRGEWEGIYDYGPEEYSDPGGTTRKFRADLPNVPGLVSRELPDKYIDRRVSRLNRRARIRQRLFLAYFDFEKGPFFARVGRQILAWGETDIFRLMDNINPLDDSFGGFLIALDERRVPLDMVRASWNFGSIGPFADIFVEGFAAEGNVVSQVPGTPAGSPWSPGGIGRPNTSINQVVTVPDATDVRGGARLVFTAKDVTFTLAHYYTYLDIPGTQYRLPGIGPNGTSLPVFENPITAYARFPRVPITGLSATFPVPSLYTIVRSEVAYFQGEPMSRQGEGLNRDSVGAPGTPGYRRLWRAGNMVGGVDPFLYPGFYRTDRQNQFWGRVLQLDTFNLSVGFDVNRFIRWLNPTQTFFFSTQVFYKHVFDSPGDLVLPVPFRNLRVNPKNSFLIAGNPGCNRKKQADGSFKSKGCPSEPRFFSLADDRILQTLLITTSYSGGRIVPFYGMFYDWQGGLVFQPGVTLVRDPFRVTFDYSRISAAPTGQFGAARDRDNVRFQVEYVF
ncbi:MAG: hypothetical protein KIT14_00060 [bacterium]|nr:hypothetical protein [bacterium]